MFISLNIDFIELYSIISLPPDWPGNDTNQMILSILVHRQSMSSSPIRNDEIQAMSILASGIQQWTVWDQSGPFGTILEHSRPIIQDCPGMFGNGRNF